RVKPVLGVLGGLAFAFTTYTMVSAEAGHIFKLLALAYLPLIFGGIHLIFSNKKLGGFALLAAGMALELAAQHYQITYYGIMLAGIMVLGYLWNFRSGLKKQLIPVILVILGFVVGVGPSIGRIWGILEYSPYSIRGEKELVSEETGVTTGLDKEY